MTPEAAMYMRRMPIPDEVWRHECPLSVEPGATKTIVLAVTANLSPGSTGQFLLRDGKAVAAPKRLFLLANDGSAVAAGSFAVEKAPIMKAVDPRTPAETAQRAR
jgi:hypothetical protein